MLLRPGRKKVARNAPKRHSSRLRRAGVFAAVVAQPMEDLSAVSITDKTVGIRLSRLRRGAEVVPGPAGHPNDGLLYSFLCTWWGGGKAERSFPRSPKGEEKTERRPCEESSLVFVTWCDTATKPQVQR